MKSLAPYLLARMQRTLPALRTGPGAAERRQIDREQRAAEAAAASRAAIVAQADPAARGLLVCSQCRTIHPLTFIWRGRERPWHAMADAQMTAAAHAARDKARQ